MRAAIEFIYENETISIEEALELRAKSRKKLGLSCVECGDALRAHRAGKNIAAHFEHLQRNNSCSFSAGASPAYTGVGYLPTYDINDLKPLKATKLIKS